MRVGPDPLAFPCGYWSISWNPLMPRDQHVKTTVLEPAPFISQIRLMAAQRAPLSRSRKPLCPRGGTGTQFFHTGVFFPLSPASSSPLMCFYYKTKVLQSQVFCRFSPLKLIVPIAVHTALPDLSTPACVSLQFVVLKDTIPPLFRFIIFLIRHINQLVFCQAFQYLYPFYSLGFYYWSQSVYVN